MFFIFYFTFFENFRILRGKMAQDYYSGEDEDLRLELENAG